MWFTMWFKISQPWMSQPDRCQGLTELLRDDGDDLLRRQKRLLETALRPLQAGGTVRERGVVGLG